MRELCGRTGPPEKEGPPSKRIIALTVKKKLFYINLNHINKIMEVSISWKIPVTELRKSWLRNRFFGSYNAIVPVGKHRGKLRVTQPGFSKFGDRKFSVK